jgi:hypothetical protein
MTQVFYVVGDHEVQSIFPNDKEAVEKRARELFPDETLEQRYARVMYYEEEEPLDFNDRR